MVNLLFRPDELLKEISALTELAGGFLELDSIMHLKQLAGDIESLKSKGGNYPLEIPVSRPLKTRVSVGEFEASYRTSSRRVYGLISGIWQVEVTRRAIKDPARPNKKVPPTVLIGFVGKASTVFDVKDEATGHTVAFWKMGTRTRRRPGLLLSHICVCGSPIPCATPPKPLRNSNVCDWVRAERIVPRCLGAGRIRGHLRAVSVEGDPKGEVHGSPSLATRSGSQDYIEPLVLVEGRPSRIRPCSYSRVFRVAECACRPVVPSLQSPAAAAAPLEKGGTQRGVVAPVECQPPPAFPRDHRPARALLAARSAPTAPDRP